ncbi:hypothetical protein [Succinivibrio dextrinosolvens]|jgi:hypothetical protein|uniref:hypothetical protein n=1 Tax=Succinivibrio dextrinosolvens TaxID=83771 RepID=UPI00241E1FC6|nr:hypothetical protein [Succinivibrio dextrinosolvens]MBE6422572.1 hypothetical protein [Succinivibrio dextrinosolvens]
MNFGILIVLLASCGLFHLFTKCEEICPDSVIIPIAKIGLVLFSVGLGVYTIFGRDYNSRDGEPKTQDKKE